MTSDIEIKPGQMSLERDGDQVVLRFREADDYAAMRLYDQLLPAVSADGHLRIDLVVVEP